MVIVLTKKHMATKLRSGEGKKRDLGGILPSQDLSGS